MANNVVLLARFTQTLAEMPARAPLATRLVAAMARMLEMGGGAITIGYDSQDRATLAATDPGATTIEELQDVFREGPSLDAFRTGATVVADLAEQARRWPLLHRGLQELGPPACVCAMPMRQDSDVLGVVSLYRDGEPPASLPVDDAEFLSGAIGVAILGRLEHGESTDLVWSSRDRVNQATGMVVAQLAVSPADALAVLRAHAYAHRTSLLGVAELVVAREIDFRDDRRGGDGRGSPRTGPS